MRVLIVDAHTDDCEISCGGTIARLKREGHEVYSIYFCPCTSDPKNVGHLEDHRIVCEHFGIMLYLEGLMPSDGYLENNKQQIRDILYQIRERLKPDLVLCPSIHDFHQDHKTIAECVMTIFRDTSTILGCEVLRSVSPEFHPNFFVILQEEDMTTKLKAIDLYKSQKIGRPYFFSVERLKAQMVMRGTQAKADWAEAFELLWGRW
jgi:LmbE family N-acetylglucosaminyl deacetylase